MERACFSESDVAQEHYIDRGQFGIVLKAMLHDGREVAIKMFRPSPNKNEERLQRLKRKFQEEAPLVSGLDHPNVVKVSILD